MYLSTFVVAGLLFPAEAKIIKKELLRQMFPEKKSRVV